ncbi:MAG: helix-turn-helix domain-containing protein [Oceanococcaceae bacterium]
MALPFDIDKPSVAASYLQLLEEILTERGFSSADLLAGLPIPQRLLSEPGARMSPLQWGLAVNRAMVLCKDQGLGYECGLRMRPTVNGYLGYAVMSCSTLQEAMELLGRYIESRQRAFTLRLRQEDEYTVVELRQNHAIPVLRSFFNEHILVGIARGAATILGVDVQSPHFADVEIWFEWREPPYHTNYSPRLPRVCFSKPANLLRFPSALLQSKPLLADPQASRQAIEQCERELAQMGGARGSITLRVCAELVLKPQRGYPDQDAVAASLNVSTRTLARQLQQDGSSFRRLLEEARHRDACHLLDSSPMDIADIAAHLGYTNPANFTRAFRQWTGQTPSAFRAQQRA